MSGSGFAKVLFDPTPAGGLVDRLVKRVDRLLKPSFWQWNEFAEEPGEEYATDPHVFAQFLPIDRTAERTGEPDESGRPTDAGRDANKDRPVVRIFHDGGKMLDFQKTIVTVTMVFEGWYDEPDNQGWRIPLMMMWQVAADLCKTHKEGTYRIETHGTTPWLQWTVGDEDTKPYWRVSLETVWVGSPPAEFDMIRAGAETDSRLIEVNRMEAD